jgi:crossover junction endodeoxyribonuclease RuvC
MRIVVGIDQSATSTGICGLDESGCIVFLDRIVPPKSVKDTERLVYIRDAIRTCVSKYTVVMAIMEGYSYGSTNKKFILGEVGAVVKLTMADADIPLKGAAPTQLKKFVTGNGNSSKQQIIASIKHKWNVEIAQNDMADAYGLARIALEIIHPSSNRRPELEIIQKITNKTLHKPRSKNTMTSFKDAI